MMKAIRRAIGLLAAVAGALAAASAAGQQVSIASSIDFGLQQAGLTSLFVNVQVSNAGAATLVIDPPQVSGPFLIDNWACGSILAFDSCTFLMRFTPPSAGPATGSMTMTSNGPGPTTVALSGRGYLALHPVHVDFDGDGKTDMVMQARDGRTVVYLMNGFSQTAWNAILGPAAGNVVTKVGDFDGDGKTDLIRQFDDGSINVYFMDGTTLRGWGQLAPPGTTLRLVNLGDFDGDGRTDLVLQDADGSTVIWILLGSIQQVIMPGAAAKGWYVTKVADFDGDGRSDLLWTNVNGGIGIWTMNGVNAIAKQGYLAGGASGWSAAGVADFNGDGRDDILFMHANGAVGLWLMNGTQAIAKQQLIGAGSGWAVTQIGDFNGDGKADLLWTSAAGDEGMWLMDGLVATSKQMFYAHSAYPWLVAYAADTTGDGKDDLVWWGWYNQNTAVSLVDGTNVTPPIFVYLGEFGPATFIMGNNNPSP